MNKLFKPTNRLGTAALVVSGVIIISLLLGQVREIVFAQLLGATAATDQYVAAFRIPDFMNYLLAGGFLSITFIPIFSRYLANDDEQGGWDALSAIVRPIAIAIMGLTVFGWFATPTIVESLYPGFTPEQIDQTIEYELRDKDAEGLQPLEEWFVIQQVELPEKMFYVTEHRARKYLDPLTGQRPIAPIPDEIRKGGLLGGRFTTMVGLTKSDCHASYGTIQEFCQEMYGLELSRGRLNKTVQKVSEALQALYEQPVLRVSHQPVAG